MLFKKGKKFSTRFSPNDDIPEKYKENVQSQEGLTFDDILKLQKDEVLILTVEQLTNMIKLLVHEWFEMFKDNWYFEKISLTEIWVTKESFIYISAIPNRITGVLQKEFQDVVIDFAKQLQQHFQNKQQGQAVNSVFETIIRVIPKIKYHWQIPRLDFKIKKSLETTINHSLPLRDKTDEYQHQVIHQQQIQNVQYVQQLDNQQKYNTNQQQNTKVTQSQVQRSQQFHESSNMQQYAPPNIINDSQIIQQAFKKVNHLNNPQQQTQEISYDEQPIVSLQRTEHINQSQQMQGTSRYPNFQQSGRQDAQFNEDNYAPPNNVQLSSNIEKSEIDFDQFAPPNISQSNSNEVKQSQQQVIFNQSNQSQPNLMYDRSIIEQHENERIQLSQIFMNDYQQCYQFIKNKIEQIQQQQSQVKFDFHTELGIMNIWLKHLQAEQLDDATENLANKLQELYERKIQEVIQTLIDQF